MKLQTNLRGRLRNTSLAKNQGLMPVFEAIVNSIHSIEEGNNLLDGHITLKIIRESQESMELDNNIKNVNPILSFIIEDNGCGFNEINFNSFQTLDSEHKIEKGCRGVGRLLWLKVFNNVNVSSTFQNNNENLHRHFKFNDTRGVHDVLVSQTDTSSNKTTIQLNGLYDQYRKAIPSNTQSIANSLLEHCLWYFVRDGGAPEIDIIDEDVIIHLSDLFNKHMHTQAVHKEILILEHKFELTHIKFRASVNKKHQIALCAANRLVKEENIQGKIPGLYQKISDSSGEFTYTCYVASKFLDENVRAERTSFEIEDSSVDGLFTHQEITLKLIREEVLKQAQEHLQQSLETNISIGKGRTSTYIDNHAPRYKPITNYINDNDLIIDPDKSDKELELHLHEKWYEVEKQILSEGSNLMKPQSDEKLIDYKNRLQAYLQKVSDIKKSDLANYVSHRKVVLDLFKKAIGLLENGNYAREDLIHELIMPMRKDSSDIFQDEGNLWLIDERLSFHNYLASDKTFNSMPITDSTSTKEPDLLSLKVFDNPILINNNQNIFPLASISIIEIKRPMRNDMKEGEDKNPIEQCLGYLKKIREGQVKTKDGLLIPNSQNIPGYCYILCDLTPTMVDRCNYAGLTRTHDGMGYFGYNKSFEAYIEVISFNQVIRAASERNKAFFDKLGLPMSS